MRVDSQESEVRQDGMLPADEKPLIYLISRSCHRLFQEMQGKTMLTVHYCIRCCIKETRHLFSLMRYCKPL